MKLILSQCDLCKNESNEDMSYKKLGGPLFGDGLAYVGMTLNRIYDIEDICKNCIDKVYKKVLETVDLIKSG